MASYSPNYFAIEDILATQERTPCRFLQDVPKLGKVNPSSEEDDIKAGTALELPMYLVDALSTGRTPLVAPELPRTYKEGYREILKADPCAVNLQKFGLHFYELGAYAKHYDHRGEVANILQHTFKTRFRLLMDLADNTVSNPTVIDKLDKLEQKLYNEGHKARMKLNAWLMQTRIPLEAAEVVVNHKKRKRVEIEDIL